jgi:hypothetical protein
MTIYIYVVPAAADAGALRGLDDAAHKKRILRYILSTIFIYYKRYRCVLTQRVLFLYSNMQGVKVMIWQVVRPPLVAAGELAAGGFTDCSTKVLVYSYDSPCLLVQKYKH